MKICYFSFFFLFRQQNFINFCCVRFYVLPGISWGLGSIQFPYHLLVLLAGEGGGIVVENLL